MINLILGIFIVLHGLVHLWYFTLSQRLIQFQAEMGWTGKSWLFTSPVGDTPTRSIASVLYILATLGFIAGGIGIFIHQTWWRPTLMISAIFSSAVILLFWDGNAEMLIQKGLIGFFINIAILVILLVFPK